MASSQSTGGKYDNINLFKFENFDLLAKSAMMKEGQAQLAEQQLEAIQQQLGVELSLAREDQREYLKTRLNQARSIINNRLQQGWDLTDETVSKTLLNQFRSVVDETILNGVVDTKTKQIERAEWDWYRVNDPQKYNDINRAYAEQNWNDYMNTSGMNARYKGGGGFIEYDDVNARLMSKEFQDILKANRINAEYIVESDGRGYFRALDTMEGTVDPNRLREITNAYIGEKGVRQLGINAWGMYGDYNNPNQVEAVRQQYNNTVTKNTTSGQNNLDAINTVLQSNSLTPEQRSMYESQRDAITNNLNAWAGRDFDTDVSNGDGILDVNKYKNIYTNQYVNSFQDNAFNLLYQAPIHKDRKIDEVQYKTALYQEDVRQFNLKEERQRYEFQETNNLAKARLALDVAKFESENSPQNNTLNSPQGGLGLFTTIIPGANSEITEEEVPTIKLKEEVNNAWWTAVNGIKNSVGGQWDVTATEGLVSYLNANDGYNIGDVVDAGGRKFTITEENAPYVESLKSLVGGNGTVRALRNLLGDVKTNYKTKIEEAYTNRTLRTNQVNDIGFIDDGNGNLIFSQNKVKGQTLSEILSKKGRGETLTEAQNKAYDYYATELMSNDEELRLNSFEKDQLKRSFYSNNSAKTNNSIPKSNNALAITTTTRTNTVPGAMRTTNDFSEFPLETSTTTSTYPRLGILNRTDRNTFITSRDALLEQRRPLLNRNEIIFISKSTATNKNQKAEEEQMTNEIKGKLGIPTTNTNDIKTQRIIKDGKITNNFEAYEHVTTGSPSKGYTQKWVKVEGKILSQEEMEGLLRGKTSFANTQTTSYNVRLGNNAESATFKPSNQFIARDVNGKVTQAPGTKDYYTPQVQQILLQVQQQVRASTGNNNYNVFNDLETMGTSVNTPEIKLMPVGGENGSYYLVDGATNSSIRNTNLKTLTDLEVATYRAGSEGLLLDLMIGKIYNKHGITQ